MFIRFTAALAAGLLLGTAAQANQISDQLTIGCTGSLNINGTDGMSMYCEGGDLSIRGLEGGIGTLNSDVGIDLFASGALDLDRVTLSAPIIRLTGGQRNIGEAGSVVRHSGSSGGDLTVVGAMPQQDRSAIYGALRTSGDVVLVNGNGSVNLAGQGGISIAAIPTVMGVMANSVAISSAVPEPGSFALLGLGLLAAAAITRRRR